MICDFSAKSCCALKQAENDPFRLEADTVIPEGTSADILVFQMGETVVDFEFTEDLWAIMEVLGQLAPADQFFDHGVEEESDSKGFIPFHGKTACWQQAGQWFDLVGEEMIKPLLFADGFNHAFDVHGLQVAKTTVNDFLRVG